MLFRRLANKYVVVTIGNVIAGLAIWHYLDQLSDGQKGVLWLCLVVASLGIAAQLPKAAPRPRQRPVEQSGTMPKITQYIAWCEKRIAILVIQEKLHVKLVRAIQGPLTITFQVRLLRPNQQSLKKLFSMGSVLAQALQVEGVRISDSANGILIEVPSPVKITPNALRLVQVSSGLTVAVGLDQYRRPVYINLADHGAVFWIGPSRRGKTQSLKSTLYALIRSNHELQYIIIAQKVKDWCVFEDVAGCLGIVSHPDEIEAVFEWVVSQLHEAGRRDTGKVVIVADDLVNLLTTSPDIAPDLEQIASMGAGLGFHLLAGTQAAGTKKGSGGTGVESNITARVLYKPASSTTGARNAGMGGVSLDQLSGAKGDAILIVDGYTTRIATAYVNDQDILQLPANEKEKPPWLSSGLAQTAANHAETSVNQFQPVKPAVDSPTDHSADMENEGTDEDASQTGLGGLDSLEFPIGMRRPPTSEEALAIQAMRHDGMSLNAICRQVYGAKDGQTFGWVKEALATPAAKRKPEAGASEEVIDLNTEEGRQTFQNLLSDQDIDWDKTREQYADRRLVN